MLGRYVIAFVVVTVIYGLGMLILPVVRYLKKAIDVLDIYDNVYSIISQMDESTEILPVVIFTDGTETEVEKVELVKGKYSITLESGMQNEEVIHIMEDMIAEVENYETKIPEISRKIAVMDECITAAERYLQDAKARMQLLKWQES